MTHVEILQAFETEIGLIDDVLNKPMTEDSLYWLNQAVAKFVKLRFNGDPVHKQGFEQTEKRSNDLMKLYCFVELLPESTDGTPVDYVVYNYKYPDGYLYTSNENVVISDNEGNNKTITCVFECTHDSFMYRINNSLTDFHYKFGKARPIRIKTANGFKLLTDHNYKINNYAIGYIKTPSAITLSNPTSEYLDFDTTTMYEIIKMAAQMFIENKKNDRYQTISNEVLTQE